MVVPELPRSRGRSGTCRRDRPPSTRDAGPPSTATAAPRPATAAAVRATSSPSDRPRMVDVPSARAASSRARWEIDLSPGTRMVPVSGRPPRTTGARRPHARATALTGRSPPGCSRRGSRAPSRVATSVGAVSVHHEHQHPAVALDAVGDLEVDDVDAEVAGQGGDLGQHPGAVGHRDPDLGQLLRARGAFAEGPPGRGGPVEDLEQRGAVAVGHPVAHRGRASSMSRSRASTMAAALSAQMSGQMRGLAGGDPGHVAEAAGGQPQQGGVLLGRARRPGS